MPAQPETPVPARPAPARRSRLLAVLRLCVFAGVAGGAWWWLQHHSGGDPKGWLEAMRSTSPWVFVALMATLPVIGFPIAVCYLYAGAAFGFFYGWLYCVAGIGIGMSLGYWLARGLLRAPLQSLLDSYARSIPAPGERHHLRAVLLVRLVPGLSFAMQNPLLALIGIPFTKYLAASLLAQGLLAMLMCAVGSVGQTPRWMTAVLIVIAVTAIGMLAHFGIRRGWRRKPGDETLHEKLKTLSLIPTRQSQSIPDNTPDTLPHREQSGEAK